MKYFLIVFSLIALSSCESSKLSETSSSQFVGTWKMVERGMLDNIELQITKDEKGKFSGVIKKLNDNKYVKIFMDEGDKILTEITRKSNFEFVISEKKIAAPLFSAYGQSTTTQFIATFENENKILLGKNGNEGKFIRVK